MDNWQRWSRIARLFGCLGLLTACTHGPDEVPFGLQDAHASYIPARIAVFPCQVWPNGARYSALPLSNAKDAELIEFCRQTDAFVKGGFENQPFMRGYSPAAVQKLLDGAGRSKALAELPALWQHRGGDCGKCTLATTYYKESIATRAEWRSWLTQLAQSLRNSDAVLLPFAMYAFHDERDDRGVLVARRAGGLVMLLVDTNRGELLWASRRDAEVVNQRLLAGQVAQDLAPPSWDVLFERLMIEEVWRDFPGRQIYK